MDLIIILKVFTFRNVSSIMDLDHMCAAFLLYTHNFLFLENIAAKQRKGGAL